MKPRKKDLVISFYFDEDINERCEQKSFPSSLTYLSSSALGSNIDFWHVSPSTNNPLHYVINNKLGMCEGSSSGWCISRINNSK